MLKRNEKGRFSISVGKVTFICKTCKTEFKDFPSNERSYCLRKCYDLRNGSNAYSTVHRWLIKNYGKAIYCSINKEHKAKRFEWANIDGIYEKDMKHFKSMCPSCHRKNDYTEHQRELTRKANTGNEYAMRRKIKQYSKEEVFIKEYKSIMDAHRQTGIHNTAISNVLSGKVKTAGGFIWR